MRQRIFHRPAMLVIVSILLVISFLAILIGAGHGIGPVAYLLVVGSPEAWLWPQVFGWLGIALEISAALVVSSKRWKSFAASGLVSLFVSVFLFVITSESLSYISLLVWFGLPFALMTVVRTVQVLTKVNENA
jgi:hypothetical protein